MSSDNSSGDGSGDENWTTDESWSWNASSKGGASRSSSNASSTPVNQFTTPPTTPAPSSPPALRRSARERRNPGEWWKTSHYAMAVESRSPVNFALLTMDEALNEPDHDKWMEAARKELENFEHYKVFELVQ
ncbi:hypothetical protein HK100_010621, partial [Physocladia obscura]